MKRMAKIHRDPVMVWSVLKEVYGLRFFEVEIQKEWDQRLAQPDEEKFLREIGSVKQDAFEQMSRIREKVETEVK